MKKDNSHRLAFPFILFIGCLLHHAEKDPKTEIRTNTEGWKVIAEKNLSFETTGYRIDTSGDKTNVLSYGPGETRKEKSFFSGESLKKILKERKPAAFLLGQSKKKRNIEAWYFPGSSDKRALVIGGVHGTELSAIEVAATLINTIKSAGNNYYSVIIVPCLFPDNAAIAEKNPRELGVPGISAGIVSPLRRIRIAKCQLPVNLSMKTRSKITLVAKLNKKIVYCLN